MNRRHFAMGLGAAATATRGVASGQDLTTVNVGGIGTAADAPLWFADERGFFRDQGLKIVTTRFTSSEQMMPLLSTGKLDFCSGAPGASFYNAVIRGVDLRAVADAATDPPGYGWAKLMIRSDLVKSGKFKTIRDLKGMTVIGAAAASSSSPQLARLLTMAGLSYNDVSRQVLAYPQHVVAFENGAIDAALTIEPFATFTADRGVAVPIISNDKFYPNQEASCILCSASLIQSRREVIVRWLRAFLQGARLYADGLAGGKIAGPNANAVISIIASHTSLDPDVIRRTTATAVDPNGHLNLSSMRDDLVFYKAQGYIQGDITVEQVVDTSLATEALKTIGLYRRKY